MLNIYPETERLRIECFSFWFGSEEREYFDRIRESIADIFRMYSKSGMQDELRLRGTVSLLLSELLYSYAKEREDTIGRKGREQLGMLMKYVGQHYSEEISLSGFAEKSHYSASHLSHLMKDELGTNFTEYLKRIRLQNALKFMRQGKSITQISESVGFVNSNAFIKAFREVYGVTPGKYKSGQREQARAMDLKDDLVANVQNTTRHVFDRLFSYLDLKKVQTDRKWEMPEVELRECKVNVCRAGNEMSGNWQFSVNGGYANRLLYEQVQRSVCRIQKEIRFQYIRIKDIFNDELQICTRNLNEELVFNYVKLDYILDFLCANHAKPWIELSFMPSALSSARRRKGQDIWLIAMPDEPEEWFQLIEHLLGHLKERYGEVEKIYETFRGSNEREICRLGGRKRNLSYVQNNPGQLAASGHCECTEKEADLYAAQDFSRDVYRPVYHLMPPGKWMNEPHAPFFYKGNYHIFYQANPHAPVWDNLCWGHLVSRDMVGWKDAGIALYPDADNIDIDGCWSGSACLDADGNPMLFYTAGNNKELPNQSVAVAHPENTDDPALRKWVKDGVVLRQSLGNGFLGEFRDPFVWRRDDTYFCLVGTGDENNGGGNALVYTSTDLKTFTCHGFVTEYDYEKCEEVGHVWELPVLLPLNDEKGEYCCDILLFCACQIEHEVVETYYFLGKFDYEKKKFQKFHEYPQLVDLGCGTFTGPSGFVTPNGRSVVFTIAQGKRKPQDEYASGWAHNGGMPIELWMKEDALCIAPVSEAKRYFSKCIVSQEIQSQNFGTRVFLAENLLEHRLCLTSEGSYAELILQWEDDGYRISYDRRTMEWRTLSLKQNTMISKIRNEEDLVDIGKEDIKIECFIDHSMIELYLNDRKGMTLRSYPFCEKNKLYVKTDGICNVSVWEYDKNAD